MGDLFDAVFTIPQHLLEVGGDLGPRWNLDDHLVPMIKQLRPEERSLALLVFSARNCPGFEPFEKQMEAHGDKFSSRALLVKFDCGDLLDGRLCVEAKLGGTSLDLPGFPTSYLFEKTSNGLEFRAVSLGPIQEEPIAQAVENFLSGKSRWVGEARALRLKICSDNFCRFLHAENAFHAPFIITV